jgi:hypothetical protein
LNFECHKKQLACRDYSSHLYLQQQHSYYSAVAICMQKLHRLQSLWKFIICQIVIATFMWTQGSESCKNKWQKVSTCTKWYPCSEYHLQKWVRYSISLHL